MFTTNLTATGETHRERKQENGEQGMSRASKKRAKKKQRHEHKQLAQTVVAESKVGQEGVRKTNVEKRKTAVLEDEKIPALNSSKRKNIADVEQGDGRNHKQWVEGEDDEDENQITEEISTVPLANEMLVEIPTYCKTLLDVVAGDGQTISRNFTMRERARCALAFLLQPCGISSTEFYQDYWEKKPLVVKANLWTKVVEPQKRLDGFLSEETIKSMLHTHPMFYGRDLNVTRYEKAADGLMRRITLDPRKKPASASQKAHRKTREEDVGDEQDSLVQVDAVEVWSMYKREGCTIRLLCPHKHSDTIHSLLSLLELEWGCMVGANAYLTPPGQAQGFAPHYDDIEAFCLQLQGRKRWKVYAPLNKAEVLPRCSSPDYTTDDLKGVEPVLDVVLESGDLLYMPRGWIHQACTLPENADGRPAEHSLHLTVSAMQHWAWVDLLEILLPEALEAAATTDKTSMLRMGLPRGFLDYMGVMHDNRSESLPEVLKPTDGEPEDDPQKLEKLYLQESFRAEAKKRIAKVAKEAMDMLDACCDEIGKRFISDRLPPAWTLEEKESTNLSDKPVKILPDSLCRLARPGIARLVIEEAKAVVYHCGDNSRVYQEKPISPLDFELDDGPALEQLLTTVEPHWICIDDLYHDTVEDKIGVSQALYDEGILAIRVSRDLTE